MTKEELIKCRHDFEMHKQAIFRQKPEWLEHLHCYKDSRHDKDFVRWVLTYPIG